jgi:oxygen-independent coproporphyrinogen-3 oxidase
VEDALAAIQDDGERLLTSRGYEQYEVSAYSQPGLRCRHNLNYWSFGDYLGIGAGAHGKVTHTDGRIQRYAKKRQPAQYMSSSTDTFRASSRVLNPDEIPGEFMLNALRLNEGFPVSLFGQRTGLDIAVVQPQLEQLLERGLLQRSADRIHSTDLGRRFLDSVVGEFFV